MCPDRQSGLARRCSARARQGRRTVGVFVEGRPVADFDSSLTISGPHGRAASQARFSSKHLEGPTSGIFGHGVEAFRGFDPGATLSWFPRTMEGVSRRARSTTAFGSAPYPTRSPEHQGLVVLPAGSVGEARLESLQIGVDVGQDQVAHEGSAHAQRSTARRITGKDRGQSVGSCGQSFFSLTDPKHRAATERRHDSSQSTTSSTSASMPARPASTRRWAS